MNVRLLTISSLLATPARPAPIHGQAATPHFPSDPESTKTDNVSTKPPKETTQDASSLTSGAGKAVKASVNDLKHASCPKTGTQADRQTLGKSIPAAVQPTLAMALTITDLQLAPPQQAHIAPTASTRHAAERPGNPRPQQKVAKTVHNSTRATQGYRLADLKTLLPKALKNPVPCRSSSGLALPAANVKQVASGKDPRGVAQHDGQIPVAKAVKDTTQPLASGKSQEAARTASALVARQILNPRPNDGFPGIKPKSIPAGQNQQLAGEKPTPSTQKAVPETVMHIAHGIPSLRRGGDNTPQGERLSQGYPRPQSSPTSNVKATPNGSPASNINLSELRIELQMHTRQAADRGSSTPGRNRAAGLEQVVLPAANQVRPPEQSLTGLEPAKTLHGAGRTNAAPTISDQIIESISNSSLKYDKQIVIRLNPPELGRVLARFQEQSNEITGILQVSKTQTRYEIEQALPHITRALADSGVQIKRLEVVLTDQADRQPDRHELPDSGSSPQHRHTHADNPNNAANEWFPDAPTGAYQDTTEFQARHWPLTDNSINIWA